MQQMLYEIHDDYYIGGQVMFVDQSFSDANPLGEIFLKAKGVEDSNRGGYGITLSYDSRSKQEKFFPTDSSFVILNINQFPEALGARNILRGFPIGLYKTRNMLAAQGEYRYRIDGSRFRLTAFGGYASLSGGSKGTASGNRDEDNGDYYSGGLGVHFILEEKQQLDYRVNVAYTSDDEASLYASINQAF